MKKYEAYKNSGIEWIGQIPEGWSVVPLKHYLSLKGRIGWNGLKSEEFQEKSYAYLVTGQDFNSDVVNWEKCYQINKERYDEDPFIQLENGDLLVTKDGTIGKVAKVVNLDKPACLNSGIFVVKQKKGVFEQNYLYWVLVSNQLKEFVGFNSTGTTIAHLYQNVFENMPLTVPSLSEQQAIASYLDHKVGQIDASVSAINAQIEDLKAYRQSVISETVTKGLNPDAPMRDSGIEWIGEIPEGWQCFPMKRGLTINNGKDYKDVQSDSGYPVIGSGGQFAYANDYLYEGEALLLGRKGTIDKPMYINGKFWTVDTMFYAVPNQNVCCRYMYYQAQTIPFGLYSTNTALPSMTQTDLADNPMCFPPLAEQQTIASYLDSKCSKIDATIASLESQRDDLNALKQSVISEAVTGKIDVREWKTNKC